jgi:pimeloyl-ACP methyl ester carboxylesterase
VGPERLEQAIVRAEARARFRVDDVSPRRSASTLRVPVLLIHGGEDHETPPDHSERIYRELRGARRLLIVPGAGHNDVLGRTEAWTEIKAFLD